VIQGGSGVGRHGRLGGNNGSGETLKCHHMHDTPIMSTWNAYCGGIVHLVA
jgi:hypothetical protein